MGRHAVIDGDELFQEVMQLDQVRRGVDLQAAKVEEKAIRYTAAAGGTAHFSSESYTLPNGRYGVRITSDSAEEEDGAEDAKRIRALRRAVREVKR